MQDGTVNSLTIQAEAILFHKNISSVYLSADERGLIPQFE